MRPIKWYKELTSPSGRRQNGFFLVEGYRAIKQIAELNKNAIEEILLEEGKEEISFLKNFPIRKITKRQLNIISSVNNPQGIIALVKLPLESYSNSLPQNRGDKIVLLEDVQDPGNVGTLIRTAAAFGFDGVILSKKCADPFSAKVVQASAGAILSLWIRCTDEYLNLLKKLKEESFKVFCADINGKEKTNFSSSERIVIILGNEGNGVSKKVKTLSDEIFSIPYVKNKIESLNVSVAGAIVLFAVFRRSGW